MYEQFYGLDRTPFNTTPDPEFLYLGPSHREALASITYGIEQRKGFIVLVGEVGLGKTTLLRSYIASRDPTRVTVAYVFNTRVSYKQLLDTICRDLGVTHPPEEDEYALVNWLHQFLLREYRHDRNVVLLVDEAQHVPVDTLERLRELSNLESEQDKLLQIVLAGQPEFARTLEQRVLRQLKQRIGVRYELTPLTEEQSREYIEFRLNRVGGTTPEVFNTRALNRIVAHASGIPRVLNILCDNAMAAGMGYQKKPVTLAIVNEVIGDLKGRPRPRLARWVWVTARVALAAGALAAGAAGLGWLYRDVIVPARMAARAGAVRTTSAAPGARGGQARAPGAQGGQAAQGAQGTSAAPAAVGSGATSASQSPAPGADSAAASSPPVVSSRATETAAARPAGRDDSRLLVRVPDVTRVVNVGDSLTALAEQVYGFVNADVLQRVLQANPDIKNPDTILLGSVIRFPDVSDLRTVQAGQKRVP